MKTDNIEKVFYISQPIYSFYFFSERKGVIKDFEHIPEHPKYHFPAQDLVCIEWEDGTNDKIPVESIKDHVPDNGHGIAITNR